MTLSGHDASRGSALEGRRIAVTRPEGEADNLAALLQTRAAIVLEIPLLRVAVPDDLEPLRSAAARLPDYDWIVFTSANAVRALRAAMGCATARPARIAAVGPATAEAVANELMWTVDVVPETYTASALTSAMQGVAPVQGSRVLWPRAAAARDVLRHDLVAAGAVLDDPVAYQSIAIPANAAALAERVAAGDVDMITFTSPSAVECYVTTSPTGSCSVAVIGPSTAAAALRAGLRVDVQPAEHTLPALVDALASYFERQSESSDHTR